VIGVYIRWYISLIFSCELLPQRLVNKRIPAKCCTAFHMRLASIYLTHHALPSTSVLRHQISHNCLPSRSKYRRRSLLIRRINEHPAEFQHNNVDWKGSSLIIALLRAYINERERSISSDLGSLGPLKALQDGRNYSAWTFSREKMWHVNLQIPSSFNNRIISFRTTR